MKAPLRRAAAPLRLVCVAIAALAAAAGPSLAVLDVDDRGPMLRCGRFNLRVTNAGIVGNAFPERSFDPSFEFPRGSGVELMRYAALWVGAIAENGDVMVSGGPNLEWRPTTAPSDTVRELWHGRLGSARGVDDDGDGAIDEEAYDDRDNDGDGEIDEDLGIVGQQMLIADYTDDRPEAMSYFYGPESHRPIGLSVHQETSGWGAPGYDAFAGLRYSITNHGEHMLHDVYIGLYVDADVRTAANPGWLADDQVAPVSYSRSIPRGHSQIYVEGCGVNDGLVDQDCFERLSGTVPAVIGREGPTTRLPVLAVLPLDHTTDPWGRFRPELAKAPGGSTFRTSVFADGRMAGAGGPPRLDAERYAALAGQWAQSPDDYRGERMILTSCGPFDMPPGRTIDFAVALVAAPKQDSLPAYLGNAATVWAGTTVNHLPDDTGPYRNWSWTGATGLNGHEVCLEPPPGVEFTAMADCPGKFVRACGEALGGHLQRYQHGSCVWTDVDCDACTGLNGNETVVRWVDPSQLPPAPSYRVTAGDHVVRIEWDNMPELLTAAARAGPVQPRPGYPPARFVGYSVYKLADWRSRTSIMPPREYWALFGSFGFDTLQSRRYLSAVTDTTVGLERYWFGRPYYPIGRYALADTEVQDGFDYVYVVTSVVEVQRTVVPPILFDRYESPISATFDQRVRPAARAKADAQGVWVVPNPFRARADWDRLPVYGDRLTRHLDFMGLPRAACTIKIFTLAGDHVATIEHDGSGGDGQAAWDLVSRNGQEVASGIYLFRVESSLGNATGRFVVIR